MIDIKFIKELLDLFDESSASDLRIEQEGTAIRMSKGQRGSHVAMMPQYGYAPMQQMPPAAGGAAPSHGAEAPAHGATAEAPARQYHEIRSPIVGTFYRAPSPEAPNFAEVGQEVSPGQVLCIIEAMKLMNEIECDVYGKIVKIAVENAQPVEYNQVLFLIDPS